MTTVQRDVVYAVTGNGLTDEYWTLSLESAGSTQLVLDIAEACVRRNARIACTPDVALGAPGTFSFHLGAHETIYLWVDSESATTTAYTITATIETTVQQGGSCDPLQLANRCAKGLHCSASATCAAPVCGDILVQGDEECDEGPLGGNGCSADCYRLGDTCNAPYDLNVLGATVASGRWMHAGSILGMKPDYVPTCSQAGGLNDVVYVFTAPADGTYTFAETSSIDAVVSLSTTCPDVGMFDLDCSDTPDTVSAWLHANDTVYLYVDRYGSTTQGTPTSGATDYALDVIWTP